MNFDEDDGIGGSEDFDLGLGPKKQTATAGRRRGGADEAPSARPPVAMNGGWDGQPAVPMVPRQPAPPPEMVKTPSFRGQVVDDSPPPQAPAPPAAPPQGPPPAAAPRRPRQQQGFVAPADERNKKKHEELEQAAASGVMEIPDLDSDSKDLTQVVAAPSKVVPSNRVQSFRELEEGGSGMTLDTWSNARGNVDLSLLTEVLCPAAQVEEGDERWDHELLLNKIMHEVTLEKEALEKEAGLGTGGSAMTTA